MAAYRQAKRMQRGVKLGENQAVTVYTTSKFESNPITIGTDDFSVEFYGTMYGSNSSCASLFNAASPSAGGDKTFSFYSRYYPDNGIYGVLFSPDTSGDGFGDQVLVQYEPGDDSKFLVTVTRQGATVKVYINGELKATKEQSAVKDLGNLKLAIANSSDVGFVRVWNYALSADEIAAHYNNGDPMGYVVPKASRYFEKSYQSNFTDGTDGWTGYRPSSGLLIESKEGILEISGDYANYQIRMGYPPAPKCASRYKMRVEFAEPVSISRYALYAFTGNSAFQENVTEPKTVLEGVTPLDNNLSQYCYIYLYGITPNTVVRIKSVTIEPAGLLAEYLPQNLMYGRDDKAIATSWLDSAKQLPLSDEYMEPLFQSIGGYDMAANGAPDILYYGPEQISKGVKFLAYPTSNITFINRADIPFSSITMQVHAYNQNQEQGYKTILWALISPNYTDNNNIWAEEIFANHAHNVCTLASNTTNVSFTEPLDPGTDGLQFDMDYQTVFDKDIVLTYDGATVSIFENGVMKAQKSMDYADHIALFGITGEVNVLSLVRIFNKALTAEEVATLHNNGNPDTYVLPVSMKQGDQRCVIEWLPANIVPDSNNPSIASEWLDTATVLPVGNAQPKITESVGGNDGIFQGNPTIIY